MVAVVILLVVWLAGLTVGLLILAIQLNHTPQVVDQEREAAAGMFDLVRGEVQDAVETMRRGDWEETRHNLEHVLMYTEAVATFWRRRAMERGGSEEPALSHVPIPGTASGRDVHGARRDGRPSWTSEGSP